MILNVFLVCLFACFCVVVVFASFFFFFFCYRYCFVLFLSSGFSREIKLFFATKNCYSILRNRHTNFWLRVTWTGQTDICKEKCIQHVSSLLPRSIDLIILATVHISMPCNSKGWLVISDYPHRWCVWIPRNQYKSNYLRNLKRRMGN